MIVCCGLSSIENVYLFCSCHFYLSVKFSYIKDGYFLSTPFYTRKTIFEANLEDARPTKLLFHSGTVLYEECEALTSDETFVMEKVPYRSILGSLLFLDTRTRHDIATVDSVLGRFVEWSGLKHLIPYLVGTPNYSIRLTNPSKTVHMMFQA